MTNEFEYVEGREWHSSSWDKFYVKGLEEWRVEEDFDESVYDNHHHYTGYVANVPDGAIFTVFSQSGDKRGTQEREFIICQASAAAPVEKIPDLYRDVCYVSGRFTVIAKATTRVKFSRLMGWWIDDRPEGRTLLEHAQLCAKYIDKRGMKTLPSE